LPCQSPEISILTTLTTRAFGAKNYDSHWNKLQAIAEAITGSKSISLTYYSYGKKELSIRRVDPYDLWHSQETIYLIGYCHLRKDLRLFAVERIQHIEITEDGFEIQSGYSLDAFTRNRFRVMQEDKTVTVRIRFSADVTDYVKDRMWHPSQKVEQQKDGSIIFTVEAAGTTELLNWVLGYGPNAEILEPHSLRERAAKAVRKMTELYDEFPKRPATRDSRTLAGHKKSRILAKG